MAGEGVFAGGSAGKIRLELGWKGNWAGMQRVLHPLVKTVKTEGFLPFGEGFTICGKRL